MHYKGLRLSVSSRKQLFFLDMERNSRPFLDGSVFTVAIMTPHHIVLAQCVSVLSQTLLVFHFEANLVSAVPTCSWTYTQHSKHTEAELLNI